MARYLRQGAYFKLYKIWKSMDPDFLGNEKSHIYLDKESSEELSESLMLVAWSQQLVRCD